MSRSRIGTLLLLSVLGFMLLLTPTGLYPSTRPGGLVQPVFAYSSGQSASLELGQSPPSFTTSTSATTHNEMNRPYGLRLDSHGDLWVADTGNSRVLEFTPPFTNGMSAALELGQAIGSCPSTGGPGTCFTTSAVATTQSGMIGPKDVVFDSSGNLWVVDTFNARVLEFTPPFTNGMDAALELGHAQGTCPSTGGPGTCFTTSSSATTQSEMREPTDVGFDSSGNLWVADHSNYRYLEFTCTATSSCVNGNDAALELGQAIGSCPSTGGPGTCFTTRVYVTTQSGMKFPRGVGFDSHGNLWVADYQSGRVTEFTCTATSSCVNGNNAALVLGQADFTHSGSATTQNGMNSPYDLRFDSAGNLWVADTGNSRVLEFTDLQLLNHGSSYISLVPGWNLVSLPTVPDNNKIAIVLQSISSDVSIVWGYSAVTKVWSFYKPGPPASGSLTTMQDGVGYWVLMTVGGVWNVTGSVIPTAGTPSAYKLSAGWNLLGFKPQPTVQNETTGPYLTSVSGSYDQNNVWLYDTTNNVWTRAAPSTWLTPGQGLWVLVTSPSGATLRP